MIGRIPTPEVAADTSDAERAATVQGRIAEFRERTRGDRMKVAREAERRFDRKVSWGVECDEDRALFTHVAAPVMTRLRQPERRVLDLLVAGGVARSRSDALGWCVRLVQQHSRRVAQRPARVSRPGRGGTTPRARLGAHPSSARSPRGRPRSAGSAPASAPPTPATGSTPPARWPRRPSSRHRPARAPDRPRPVRGREHDPDGDEDSQEEVVEPLVVGELLGGLGLLRRGAEDRTRARARPGERLHVEDVDVERGGEPREHESDRQHDGSVPQPEQRFRGSPRSHLDQRLPCWA